MPDTENRRARLGIEDEPSICGIRGGAGTHVGGSDFGRRPIFKGASALGVFKTEFARF